MAEYTCQSCQATFLVGADVLARFPGWTPRFCMKHRGGKGSKVTSESAAPRDPNQPVTIQRLPPGRAWGSKTFRSTDSDFDSRTPEEVLERFSNGITDGVFTDGGCTPNPGPGGWGAVYVQSNEIVWELKGGERLTTNNRMEMTAILSALAQLPSDAEVTLFSDSDLCVKTLTLWAKTWKSRGWKKKDGEIKNLDLVIDTYELLCKHPKVKVQWIKAHNGQRWNEYADALATAGMRQAR